jgi:hypothetical protein
MTSPVAQVTTILTDTDQKHVRFVVGDYERMGLHLSTPNHCMSRSRKIDKANREERDKIDEICRRFNEKHGTKLDIEAQAELAMRKSGYTQAKLISKLHLDGLIKILLSEPLSATDSPTKELEFAYAKNIEPSNERREMAGYCVAIRYFISLFNTWDHKAALH